MSRRRCAGFVQCRRAAGRWPFFTDSAAEPRVTSAERAVRPLSIGLGAGSVGHAADHRVLREVQALLFDDERAAHDALIDAQDILAEQADEEYLHGAEEEHADQHRGHAGREAIPPDELHDEVNDGDQHADGAADGTEEHGHTEADLGVAGEAEHRGVVQGVEVVVCDAGAALRLGVRNFLPVEAELGDDATQERRRVIELPHDVDEGVVVEAEAGELRDLVDGGHLLDELVVEAAEGIHKRIFLRVGLHADGDLVALLPGGDELRDHLDRVLEVGGHEDRGVAGGLQHRVVRAVELAEVLRIEDGLHLRILGTEAADQRARLVVGIIVDVEELVAVLREFGSEHAPKGLVERNDVLLLVIAWNDDADGFQNLIS